MASKVENYKITPDMKKFVMYYKRINKIGDLLNQSLSTKLSEADYLRGALEQVNSQRDLLFRLVPKKPVYELEGQE